MKIYKNVSELTDLKKAVITIGTFDGLHVGHLDILKSVSETSKRIEGHSLIITFDPHPRSVVSNDFEIKMINSLDEKIKLFEQNGFENLLIINFTNEFANLTSEKFLSEFIIKNFELNSIVIGYDHRFGKNRDGDEESLVRLSKVLNFNVISVPAVKIDGEEVSSSKIRIALQDGKIDLANRYLGRNYSIYGVVVEGAKRGRQIGVPTANIQVADKDKLIPKSGVYIVKAYFATGESFYGVMNIGFRPTYNDVKTQVVEAHLFEFNKEIYGEEIEIQFIKFLRAEIKFSSTENLIEQIKKDIKDSFDIIKK